MTDTIYHTIKWISHNIFRSILFQCMKMLNMDPTRNWLLINHGIIREHIHENLLESVCL